MDTPANSATIESIVSKTDGTSSIAGCHDLLAWDERSSGIAAEIYEYEPRIKCNAMQILSIKRAWTLAMTTGLYPTPNRSGRLRKNTGLNGGGI